MGKIPKIRTTLKTMKKLLPIMRCSDAAVISMRYSTRLLGNLIRKRMKLDNYWLSKQLEMKMIELASTEDFYDCLSGEIGFCYPPKIEGAHDYNLKFETVSESLITTLRKFDTIQCSIGFTLKSYCSRLARTMTINPTKQVDENVGFAGLVHGKIIEELKDGVELSKVYATVQLFAKTNNEILAKHLEENLGFLLDPNFKNQSICINSKSKVTAQKDMIFVITVNLVGLKEEGKEYDLRFSDTVVVRKDEPANILTNINRAGNKLNLR